jgi:hypothetical protein
MKYNYDYIGAAILATAATVMVGWFLVVMMAACGGGPGPVVDAGADLVDADPGQCVDIAGVVYEVCSERKWTVKEIHPNCDYTTTDIYCQYRCDDEGIRCWKPEE